MLNLTATVHHGSHYATVTATVDDHKGSHDDIVRQVCERLQAWRDDPSTGLGTYIPAPGLIWHQVARLLIHEGSAEHGWVRFSLED